MPSWDLFTNSDSNQMRGKAFGSARGRTMCVRGHCQPEQ